MSEGWTEEKMTHQVTRGIIFYYFNIRYDIDIDVSL